MTKLHEKVSSLRFLYQRNCARGLVFSVVLHLALIGTYYCVAGPVEAESPLVRIILKPTDIPQPPTILPHDQPPPVDFVPTKQPDFGLPVPIPDAEVRVEQNFPTQGELSHSDSKSALPGSGAGNVVYDSLIMIDGEPALDAFISVEKDPVAVVALAPKYPDVARRAGLEGSVWVKLLVGKDGKVSKVVVVKSDNELFDLAATEAAKSWVFTPAVTTSGPVVVWVTVPFRFRLNK